MCAQGYLVNAGRASGAHRVECAEDATSNGVKYAFSKRKMHSEGEEGRT
jgi:hypothetical protein